MFNSLKISSGFCFLVLCILLLAACSDTDNDSIEADLTDNKTYPLADENLWPYYESFEAEALQRGYTFDLAALEISGEIENITEDGVAGTCQYGQHIHHVTIDDAYWASAPHLRREMVVYHELGHCVLNKDHNEDYNREDTCLSIMNSGTAPCSVAYTHNNRAYYIDELFSNLE